MSKTALIIDDDRKAQAEVKQILSQANLFDQYLEANDGIEGFKILLNKEVDIVLCDVMMPGIDGFKFLSMKRARPEFNDIPVIMLTGAEDVKLKVKALDQGASDYITKPFDPQELIARVKVHHKSKM